MTGNGVQKKSVVTAAISQVSGDELAKGSPTNFQNALKGKVSGVQIMSESGAPGAGSTVRIRGVGTINNSNPLYLVDGMPVDDINITILYPNPLSQSQTAFQNIKKPPPANFDPAYHLITSFLSCKHNISQKRISLCKEIKTFVCLDHIFVYFIFNILTC